ncbi:hypothetical protein [Calothrix sp. NIES-2100]|uniref:hypothetical protein n=1 Tax=Calothrix sp. NIES-2100 TaxID=1954172 RepID=UPI0030DCA89E
MVEPLRPGGEPALSASGVILQPLRCELSQSCSQWCDGRFWIDQPMNGWGWKLGG